MTDDERAIVGAWIAAGAPLTPRPARRLRTAAPAAAARASPRRRRRAGTGSAARACGASAIASISAASSLRTALTRVDTGCTSQLDVGGWREQVRHLDVARRRASARSRSGAHDHRHPLVHGRQQRVGVRWSRSCTCRAPRRRATASARTGRRSRTAARPARAMRIGCLPRRSRPPFVEAVGRASGSDAAGTRCETTAFDAIVSARALIIRAPIDGSFAQRGTSPQRTCTSSRSPLRVWRTTGIICVGAML